MVTVTTCLSGVAIHRGDIATRDIRKLQRFNADIIRNSSSDNGKRKERRRLDKRRVRLLTTVIAIPN